MKSFYCFFKDYLFSNIKELPRDTIIILYGSCAYGVLSSDLDVVFILQSYDEKLYNKIEDFIIQFQKENNFKIDVEVPYRNKLIYTFTEVYEILDYSLFITNDNNYNITPITVSEEYFSGSEMRKRLLLNILTTYTKIINGNRKTIRELNNLAWKNLVKIVSEYNSLSIINVDEFIKLLFFDKKTNVACEDYLGYKRKNPKLEIHLRKELINILKDLEKDKIVFRNDSKNYTLL